MRELIITAAATVAIFCVPTAHADPDNGAFSGPAGDRDADAMWTDISFMHPPSATEAGGLATSICRDLEGGMSEGHLIGKLADPSSPPVIPVDEARLVVHASEWHYCPDKY